MKKAVLCLVVLFLAANSCLAQDAFSFYKKAKKAFDKYQQSEDSGKLEEALSYIKQSVEAVQNKEGKKADKIWMKAGEIYNDIALSDYKIYLVNNNHLPVHPNASMSAYQSYLKVIETAEKKWDKSKALDELLKTATFISNEGIVSYNIEQYEKAFRSFEMVIEIRNLLNDQEHVSILKNKNEYNQHIFKTALAAQKSNHPKEAVLYFEELLDAKFKNPAVYTSLYALYSEHNQDGKALQAIKDGKILFPENEGLMVAEINHFLKKGNLNELTEKLENAIQSNPKNVSLYSTLGHVYNELQNAEADKGNFTMAKNYFNQSMDYFTKALEIDDNYAPALYNIGALYYNNAAILTKEIQSKENDYSSTGIRITLAKRSELLAILEKALPYFQKAEAINPNDLTTLEALAEIYTRKENDTLSQEFKSRLEKVKAGELLESGYFNN